MGPFKTRRHTAQVARHFRIKNLGWEPTITLRDGIARFYEWFLDNYVPQTMASVR